MMKKYLIVANWKMNPQTPQKAEELFEAVARGVKGIKQKNTEVVVCPPFVYLSALKRYNHKTVTLGAQDCFWEERGPYTGEISPIMLKKAGCRYVIIGHSERREYLKETDAMCNKKILASVQRGLHMVFCVGEKKGQQLEHILSRQLERGLKKFPFGKRNLLTLAYEPVWAIGTGDACKPENAYVAKTMMRKIIARIFNRSFAKELRIIYGGSVESGNAAAYISESQMQGFIVGHESLDIKEFTAIITNTGTALSSRSIMGIRS